jgi:hypothetical protein
VSRYVERNVSPDALNRLGVPTTAEVSWLLPDEPFTYFRCTITEWSVQNKARWLTS